MEIQLSAKAEEIVKEKIASGIYTTPAEFVSAIILRYEAYYRKKLNILNQEIALGLAQSQSGESEEIDFDEFMQEIDKELGYTK